MKLLTLNTHSYIESNPDRNIEILTDAVKRTNPDVIALQEINQLSDSPYANRTDVLQLGIPLKTDNYGLRIADSLGGRYHFVWLGIKRGFEIFDEGLCFLCKNPVSSLKAFQISKCSDPLNWKKRMALGILADGQWFYNIHTGRWDDAEESFKKQWDEFESHIDSHENTWVMGDFNSPSEIRGEGYDYLLSSGWHDTFRMAERKDDGYTACGKINGWEDKHEDKKRIDYIFSGKAQYVESSFTIFNGENEEIISDHYGVLINCRKE